jgi:hypothetical protein
LVYPTNQITLNNENRKKAVANLRGERDLPTTRLRWAKPVQEFEAGEGYYGRIPGSGYPNMAPAEVK